MTLSEPDVLLRIDERVWITLEVIIDSFNHFFDRFITIKIGIICSLSILLALAILLHRLLKGSWILVLGWSEDIYI